MLRRSVSRTSTHSASTCIGSRASTEELFGKADPAFFDKVVTIKPLGDMPAVRALGQVVATHGMMHVGQMELIRTLVGAGPVVNV